MNRFYWTVVVATLLVGCMSQTTKQTLEEYNQLFERLTTLEQVVNQTDWNSISGEKIMEIYSIGRELYYNYNPMDLKPEQITACEALKERVNTLRVEIMTKTEEHIPNFKITPWKQENTLLEKSETYPVYLQRGEKLRWNIVGENPVTVKICNADSRKVLKTYKGKSTVIDSLAITNTAIYFVEINPNGVQYVDFDINYKITSIPRLCAATPINKEVVDCSKTDFGAQSVKGISMRNCFDEPRKFTLRGQLKAMFSGNSKALVAVQVPAGATDVLYSVRVSTSEQNNSTDGEFHNNLTRSYKKIKLLGLPFYEREKTRGVFMRLLDDNRPIREEDAFCNMYVFRNQAQAKQFQDGTKSASQLNYDVDYSTVGTQSCNGRIPTKGAKTIYLGFENERMRYVNYLWVEVVAVTPTTEYYTTKYSVQ